MHSYFTQHCSYTGLQFNFVDLNPCQLVHFAIKLICSANCIEYPPIYSVDPKHSRESKEIKIVADWKMIEDSFSGFRGK